MNIIFMISVCWSLLWEFPLRVISPWTFVCVPCILKHLYLYLWFSERVVLKFQSQLFINLLCLWCDHWRSFNVNIDNRTFSTVLFSGSMYCPSLLLLICFLCYIPFCQLLLLPLLTISSYYFLLSSLYI